MSGRALPRPSGQLTALLDLIITFILRDGERSMEGMGETGKEQYRDDEEKRKDRHPSHMRSPPNFSAMVAPWTQSSLPSSSLSLQISSHIV